MADITKSSDAGLEGNAGSKENPQTRQAGVELAAGDAVYIDTNGRFVKAITTAQFASGTYGTIHKFAGLTARAIPSGTYGEIYGQGAEFFYADSGLTIGAAVYPSNTAGKLADAPVSANDNPVALIVSATNLVLIAGV
jgi:hypothetical protein